MAASQEQIQPRSIEDTILENDMRGVSELRGHLPADFCIRAAQYILDNPGAGIMVTGSIYCRRASIVTSPRAK